MFGRSTNVSKSEVRAELAGMVRRQLEETVSIMPDSEEKAALSARLQDADFPQSGHTAFLSMAAGILIGGTGLDGGFWNARVATLKDTYSYLINDHLPVKDSFLDSVRTSMSIADGDIASACQLIESSAKEALRLRYFTVDTVDTKRGVMHRIHSSDPSKLPLVSHKPLPPTIWTELLINQRSTMFASDVDGAKQELPDFGLFRSLGCHSFYYIPVSLDPDTHPVGMLTFLGKRNQLTKEHADKIEKVRHTASIYLSLAHTGLYLKNPSHTLDDAGMIPARKGEDG